MYAIFYRVFKSDGSLSVMMKRRRELSDLKGTKKYVTDFCFIHLVP